MRMFKVLLSITLLFPAAFVMAQDAIFSQFYASPMLTNPALTGVGLCGGRAVMQYRDQWPKLGGNYRTGLVAYDQVAPSVNGAFGIYALNDVAGDGLLTTLSLNGVYNYLVPLGKNWRLNLALQGTYVQRSIDFNKLKFADQIEPKKGFVKPTSEQVPFQKVTMASFSTGAVISNEKFYAGLAVFHLNQPSQSFYGTTGPGTYLPRRVNLHAGTNIRVGHRYGPKREDDLILSPNVLLSVQQNFSQLNLGFYANKGGFVCGLWWRQTSTNPDALIAIVGMSKDQYKIGYSYDVTVSSARSAVKGSHEISVAYQFCSARPTPKKWLNDICPKF
ncbi:MAG: type IX secretion system membrane protein PorP/SprF [Bacteroidetes bacterium]|nr:type IX secretion system membrane protein PorP/SprF [Bacteroidota bacterium]